MKKLIKRFSALLMAALMFCFTVAPVSAAEEFSVSYQSEYFSISSFENCSGNESFNSAFPLVFETSFPFVFETDFPFLDYIDTDKFFILGYDCYLNPKSFDVYCFSKSYFWDFTFTYYGPSSFYHHLKFPKGLVCYIYRFNVSTTSVTLSQRFSDSISLYCDVFNDGSRRQFYFNKSILNNIIIPTFDYNDDVQSLGIDVQGFYDWYNVSTNKYFNYLLGECNTIHHNGKNNFNINRDNLLYLLNYYNNYGSSFDLFYNHYSELSPCYLNSDFVGKPDKIDFTIVYDTLNKHYQDYLKYKSMFLPEVRPNTEEDTTLITDIDVDTVDISLLREIVRILINIYNRVNDIDLNFNAYTSNIYFKLDSLFDDLADLNLNLNNFLVGIGSGSSSGDSDQAYDLEKLFIIDYDSVVYDEYMNLIQDKFYTNNYDALPDLEDFIESTEIQTLSASVDDDSNLSDNLNQYHGYFEPPVVRLKKPALVDNKITFTDDDVTYVDFSGKRWSDIAKLVRGIVGCLILLFFSRWIVKFVPGLLAGYSNGGE